MDRLTFFFTDIEDSTALWERDPEAMHSAIARHDAVMTDVIERHAGRAYKSTGDGVCATFEQPSQAVSAAVTLQRALATVSWAPSQPLRVRIGIAFGDARVRAGDYYGPAVNLVARLLSLCRGGQILLSEATALAVDESSITGARIKHHGWYRLKGIEEPVEVAELTADAVVCVPPPDSEKAYRVVRIGDQWRPLRDIPHNLAPERDQFIGREAALRELVERFERKTRLLTVLGTGGIGKTRLVRHYAANWLGEWPGGIYFCDLSEARSVEGIHFAVSMALGVPLGRGDAGTQLGHAIAARGACLVILDNFEQVQKHSVSTVGRWIDEAAQARFLVTSRERLQVPGEDVFELQPMDMLHDAIALFEARAREQRPGFAIDSDADRQAVAEIVRLLDGLPLAIELAAARVRVLSPAQIVERLKDRFALLGGARGVAARQATLRATFDWSWALLAPWEQLALAQCSIFDGGFTLAAAEAVLDLPAGTPPIVDVIQGLVDKSLLRALPPKSSRLDIAEPYFGLYISIHEYAGEKLRELGCGYGTGAEQRHGHYFASFGSDAAINALSTHGGLARHHRLAAELDNLVTACRRAIARAEPETAAACFLAAFAVLEAQGPFTLAETLGRSVARLSGLAPAQRAKVLTAVANAMLLAGHPDAASAAVVEALAAARAAHDQRVESISLHRLAIIHHRTGHPNEAHECFSEALALCKENDPSWRGVLLGNIANLQMEQGRMADAQASYQAALNLHRETGNRAAEGIVLGNLGTLYHELGQFAEARAAYEGALAIHGESGNVLQRAITLGNLGVLANDHGNREEALAHCMTALSIHRAIGNRRGVGVILKQMGEVEQALGDVAHAEARFHEALAIFREVGHRRFEAGVLGNIGDVMIDQRRLPAALEMIRRGEEIFRQIDDPLSLAGVLCTKGRALAGLGDAPAAHAVMVEAEAIATRLGATPGSRLQQEVARLREALH